MRIITAMTHVKLSAGYGAMLQQWRRHRALSQLGFALDATLEDSRIECFFPADNARDRSSSVIE